MAKDQDLTGVVKAIGHVGKLEESRIYIDIPHQANPILETLKAYDQWLGAQVEIHLVKKGKRK